MAVNCAKKDCENSNKYISNMCVVSPTLLSRNNWFNATATSHFDRVLKYLH